MAQISAWLESPQLVLLSESAAYWDVLSRLLERGKIAGRRVHDGRIAALCIQHGVRELLSADRDFSRFGDLKTRNPLLTP
jgi:predicted nucleic acid-binding protein